MRIVIPTQLAAALAFCSLLAACTESKSSAQTAPTPPPTAVSVVEVAPEAIPILNELPGRIAPTRIAEVRPRVSGIVVERVFTQGSRVEQGEVLYRIDPAPFRVQVESAEATLQRAKAVQLQARQHADRQKELGERNIASAQQLDNAVAQLAQANADVAAAEAGLAAARLNLEYAEVKAPITGRIGRALITEGALVAANSTQNLATIQQLDPVYADFTQSANELMRLRRLLEAGALTSPTPGEARVLLRFDDGSEYPHPGRLLFSEAAVDETTGQVTLRGEFPNPKGDLLPGMYVRVLLEQGVQKDAIAVPQQAVQRDTSGRAQVFVVKSDNTTELRTVRLGRAVGERWVVEDGLAGGDRVIVEGLQKIRPGAVVAPSNWKASAKGEAPGQARAESNGKTTVE
ncbi:efflux RND transporter periplasmic adaptor subunit [Microvirga massiliensis]|uniref:efflux RND transporter periplasmic adaptor subunit n=1 Tax=Microvirga massiliensis TaxID=1033741 RepID=UPI00062BC66B|nr:efflux RND transporter periplasmic adaptor subunit [Microvirga massiliensis]